MPSKQVTPRWTYVVPLERTPGVPLFLEIARAITEDIRRGRLRPGDRLPGSRTVARALHLNRNTVVAAYDELLAEGWVSSTPASGTYVIGDLPARAQQSPARAARGKRVPDYTVLTLPVAKVEVHGEAPLPAGVLNLSSESPDTRLLIARTLSRAFRHALVGYGSNALAYGDRRGHVELRAALATMLTATRGLAVTADDVVITSGSQMAITLLAQVLLRPGQIVAVEGLGYRPVWEALRLAGAQVVPVAVDHAGMQVARLQRLVKTGPLRAVYLTPHHQFPTTVTLSPARRLELLDFAHANRVAIIEDDYDHEFHYAGRPILPLASSDSKGVVIYVGTLSKVFAPGIRVGYVVAPRPVLDRVTACRSYLDIHGNQAMELAIAKLLQSGEIQRHIQRARRIYAARCQTLMHLLTTRLSPQLTFEAPSGGTALWARVNGVDVDEWVRRSRTARVVFYPGGRYAFDRRPIPFARFTFASLNEIELEEGVSRMTRALGSRTV